LLNDHETKDLLNSKFHLLILDGAFAECALGLQYRMGLPFMYINTVGFFVQSAALAGSPAPYSITPHFSIALTDDMSFVQRIVNSATHALIAVTHSVSHYSSLKLNFHASKLVEKCIKTFYCRIYSH